MRVVLAGGTGFLGSHLRRALIKDGHDVAVVSRTAGVDTVGWDRLGQLSDGAGAVVHLAGATIARRWTRAWKQEILRSRVETTRAVAEAVRAASRAPPVVVTQSAVGYYGPRGAEEVTEDAAAGDDFLARVCRDWEAEAQAMAAATRVVVLRTGVVLARDGGALARMWTPFRWGLGGTLGDGRQAFPWIHVDDWVELVRFVLEKAAAVGPINAVAPGVVTQRELAAMLGRVLGRPAKLPMPAALLRVLLGEMATMLVTGQRAVPRHALALGFRFRYPNLEEGLRQIASRH